MIDTQIPTFSQVLQLNSTDNVKSEYAAYAKRWMDRELYGIAGVHTAYTKPSSIED